MCTWEDLHSQLRLIRDGAEDEGWMVVLTLEEYGEANRLDRPLLTLLRDAVHAGIVDVVVVRDLERFASFPSDLALLMDEFADVNCAVATLDSAVRASTDNTTAA